MQERLPIYVTIARSLPVLMFTALFLLVAIFTLVPNIKANYS